MLMVVRSAVFLASVALATQVAAGGGAQANSAAPLRIEPERMTVGTFFRGGTVRMTGQLEPGSDVIVVITGRTIEETYNRKGRIGPLWASVGKVTIGEMPILQLVASGAPVSKLLSAAAIDEHLIGLEALVRRATIRPGGLARDTIVREYMALKRQQGLVGVFEEAVRVQGSSFEAAIPWPAAAPIGTYQIAVWYVRDLAVVRGETRSLEVAYVGLPRLVAYLAYDRSLAYGVISVVIALSVGLLMGLLFKKRAAGH
jgi:hypothetical protein